MAAGRGECHGCLLARLNPWGKLVTTTRASARQERRNGSCSNCARQSQSTAMVFALSFRLRRKYPRSIREAASQNPQALILLAVLTSFSQPLQRRVCVEATERLSDHGGWFKRSGLATTMKRLQSSLPSWSRRRSHFEAVTTCTSFRIGRIRMCLFPQS